MPETLLIACDGKIERVSDGATWPVVRYMYRRRMADGGLSDPGEVECVIDLDARDSPDLSGEWEPWLFSSGHGLAVSGRAMLVSVRRFKHDGKRSGFLRLVFTFPTTITGRLAESPISTWIC